MSVLPDYFNPYTPNNNTTLPPPPQENVFAQIPGMQPGALPSAYQVKPEDNSLSDVANGLGVPLQQLVDANDGAKTLPPIGSYMAVKPSDSPTGIIPPKQQTPRRNADQWWRDKPASPALSGANLGYEQLYYTEQAKGVLKQEIDKAAATGGNINIIIPNDWLAEFGATPQSMQANGFTYNTANGTWVPGGMNNPAPGAPGTTTPTGGKPVSADFMNTKFMQYNTANGIGFYDQLRWDPSTKKYVKIGDLLRQGKLDIRTGKDIVRKKHKGGGGAVQPAQPAQPTSTATANTVLALQLGSG